MDFEEGYWFFVITFEFKGCRHSFLFYLKKWDFTIFFWLLCKKGNFLARLPDNQITMNSVLWDKNLLNWKAEIELFSIEKTHGI